MTRDRQKPEVSRAIWIPFIWLFFSASRGRISPAYLDAMDYVQGSPALRMLYSSLILVGVIVLVKRGFTLRAFVRHNTLIFALFVLMGTSILWSAFPLISLKRWIKTVGVLVMVLLVLTESDPLKAFCSLIRRFSYAVLPLSIILIFFFPSFGRHTLPGDRVMWVGITAHKNTLAQAAVIGSLYFTWALTLKKEKERVFVDGAFLALSLFVIVGCESITALFAYFTVLGTVLIVRFGRASVRYTGIIIVYLLSLVGSGYFIVDGLVARKPIAPSVVGAFGRDMTFTGRTELWADLWEIGTRRPVLGYGFGGFWVGDLANRLWEKYNWHPIDAHNGYADVFLEMGLVGLVLMLLIILKTYKDISAAFPTDVEGAGLRTMLFFMILIHNLNETSLCNLNHPFWFLFLFAAVVPPAGSHAQERLKPVTPAREPVSQESRAVACVQTQVQGAV